MIEARSVGVKNIHTQTHATPWRDRRIMLRTRAQGRKARDRIGEGGQEAQETP